jgi:hypothetical protein
MFKSITAAVLLSTMIVTSSVAQQSETKNLYTVSACATIETAGNSLKEAYGEQPFALGTAYAEVPEVGTVEGVLILTVNPKTRTSRYNLYLRDLFTCQYCYTQLPTAKLTMDHVLPISKGGKTNWENIVTACNPCNGKKGNDERIRPKTRPYQPDYFELANKRKQIEFTIKHPSWEQFLR